MSKFVFARLARMVCLEDMRFILIRAESPYVLFVVAACVTSTYKQARERNDPKSLVKGMNGC